jgi:hypothetical protein
VPVRATALRSLWRVAGPELAPFGAGRGTLRPARAQPGGPNDSGGQPARGRKNAGTVTARGFSASSKNPLNRARRATPDASCR